MQKLTTLDHYGGTIHNRGGVFRGGGIRFNFTFYVKYRPDIYSDSISNPILYFPFSIYTRLYALLCMILRKIQFWPNLKVIGVNN